MDHPNIAQVLDGGTTTTGRPFFVMELVRGIPITEYCDQADLSTHERLELFIRVCRAVQHAHQKGVIHRDLKPSNVLVTLHDGEPVPKVIDFGVAKALGQKLTDKTLFTRFEQMIGTPAYMSPEQAALSGLDIDTRSDIYSLGVLLYELLTGVTPLDAETLRQGALDEIRRMIRETDPPKPSTRLLTLGDRLAEVAKHRHVEPAMLSRLVRGDLDWITMKALEKDRQRRYETVNGLAVDLQRHLDNEPVVARPPSNLYRFQKLVRRNKLAFAGASLVTLSLVLGLVATTWQAARATRAEREQARLRGEADKARLLESQSRQRAESAGAAETKARRQAENNAQQTQTLLRRAYLGNANELTARGDFAGSLPWLVEALKLAANEKWPDQAIRRNISATLDELPELNGGSFLEVGDGPTADAGLYETGWNAGRGSVALSRDCRLVAICKTMAMVSSAFPTNIVSHIYICETATGTRRNGPFLAKRFCNRLCFSPDSQLLLVDTEEGVLVWDVVSGEQVAHLLNRKEELRAAWLGCNDFSQDGRRALLVGQSGAVIWDRASKESTQKVAFNEGPTFYATWSPDARFVFRQQGDGSRPGGIQVWDLVQGRSFSLPSPKAAVYHAVFSPDGKFLVCFYHDYRSYDIIDLERRQPVQVPAACSPAQEVRDGFALFSPDSSQLLLSVGGWSARLGTASWQTLPSQLNPSSSVSAAIFCQDGHQFALVTENHRIEICDAPTGSSLGAILLGTSSSDAELAFELRFSPDGQFLLFATPTAAWQWSPRDSSLPCCNFTNPISLLQFSPDGKRVLVATTPRLSLDWENRYRLDGILDSGTKRQIVAIPGSPGFGTATFSSDGARVLLEASRSGLQAVESNSRERGASWPRDKVVLNLLDAIHGNAISTNIEAAFPVFPSAGGHENVLIAAKTFSYAGDLSGISGIRHDHPHVAGPIKFFREDKNGSRYDESKPILELNDSLGFPIFASFGSGGHLLLLQRSDYSVCIYDLTNKDAGPVSLPHTNTLVAAAFSENARWLATLCQDGAFKVWDLPAAALCENLRWTNLDNIEMRLAFSEDERYALVRCVRFEPSSPTGRTLKNNMIWHIYDLKERYPAFTAPDTALFLPDTKRSMVVGGAWNGLDDNSARVVDTATRRPITPPLSHDARVNEAVLSPDGRLAATASDDKTARVWDTDTGEAVTPPLFHTAPLTTVSFSPDSSLLVTGTRDGCVRFWSLRPVSDSIADLQSMAMVYSGRRVDPGVGLVRLTPDQLRSAFESWRRTHRSGF
jgi:WD40 repeat protein